MSEFHPHVSTPLFIRQAMEHMLPIPTDSNVNGTWPFWCTTTKQPNKEFC